MTTAPFIFIAIAALIFAFVGLLATLAIFKDTNEYHNKIKKADEKLSGMKTY